MLKPFFVYEKIRITEFYSMFENKFESDYSFDGESHNFWECVIVLEGKICACEDSRIYHLEQGDVIFHKPIAFHKLFVENCTYANLFIFTFSGYGTLLKQLYDKTIHLSDEQEKHLQALLCYLRNENKNNIDPNSITSYLERFEKSDTYSYSVSLYTMQFLISVCKSNDNVKRSNSSTEQLFEKIIQYMNDNINNNISVEEIAKYCFTSQTALKKVFKKYTDLGIHKYFLKMKINHLLPKILNGESITETALKYGFCSQAYFSSVFKREMGLSPSAYIEKYSNKSV